MGLGRTGLLVCETSFAYTGVVCLQLTCYFFTCLHWDWAGSGITSRLRCLWEGFTIGQGMALVGTTKLFFSHKSVSIQVDIGELVTHVSILKVTYGMEQEGTGVACVRNPLIGNRKVSAPAGSITRIQMYNYPNTHTLCICDCLKSHSLWL